MDPANPTPDESQTATPSPPREASISAVLKMLRFYSRLPVPVFAFETAAHAMPDFSRHAWAVPLAGAMIGACGAAIGGLALMLGLSPLIVASLAIASLVFLTGAFHEDGLADSADGLWGGMSAERRLDIMKDSRIGTFGGAALALSLILRIAALSELYRLIGGDAGWLLLASGGLTRTLALLPTQLLEPATRHGLGAKAQAPGEVALGVALFLGVGMMATATSALDLLIGFVIVSNVLGLALWWVIATLRTKIGGYTGDSLGATQQVCEIILLVGLAAAAGWSGSEG